MEQTTEIQKIATRRAVAMLRAAGCRFKVIEPTGEEHGELVIAPPEVKKRRGPMRHPRGTMLGHFEPYFTNALPNMIVNVPYGKFTSRKDSESLQASICAYLGKRFGKGSYQTHCSANGVEVMLLSS